jgi:large subunit ribosomal protein L28
MTVKAMLDHKRAGTMQQSPRHGVGITLTGHQNHRSTHRPPLSPYWEPFSLAWVSRYSRGRTLSKTIVIKRALTQGGFWLSAHCQVTGRTPSFGNAVSHSHRRTRRRWSPNIQAKTYYLPSEGRRIRLRVSAKGIKVIDRDGIEAVVARLRRQGIKL